MIIILFSKQQMDIPFDLGTQVTSLSSYNCLKQKYDDVIIWVTISEKGIQDSSRQMFTNAKSAGLKTHLSFVPCRTTPI